MNGWDTSQASRQPADAMPGWDGGPARTPLAFARWGQVRLQRGDRVRLRPRGGADAFDLLLQGRTATIAAIEQDYEDRVYLAVTVDDDPGKDLGEMRQIGHRFFFTPDEIEPLRIAGEAGE